MPGAIKALKAVGAATEQINAGDVTPEFIQAKALLATLMGQLGYWDLAASNWAELDARMPLHGEMSRQAAIAFLTAGQPDLAIRQLDRLKPTDEASTPRPEVQRLLLKAHLQKQLGLPADKRDWREFLTALEAVKKDLGKTVNDRLPERLETLAAEIRLLEVSAN